jgi:thiamine pyrophosphokinase
MMRCVILGASPGLYWDERWVPDLVVCADGGFGYAKSLGLTPDIIIGDFDSTGSGLPLPCPSHRLPTEKSMTDMEACIDYALEAGCGEIALLGATGGRLDHFLGNIGLLERAGGSAFMLDSQHEIRLLTSTVTVRAPYKYRYFSVIPLDGLITGVAITGAKYPLGDAALCRGATVGVSNEPLEGVPLTVSVQDGKALLILSQKR